MVLNLSGIGQSVKDFLVAVEAKYSQVIIRMTRN